MPRNLVRWRNYSNYEGHDFVEYFIVLECPADAGPAQRSNFLEAERLIKLDTPSTLRHMVITPRFSDHYYRWRRFLMVHQDCAPGLRIADEVVAKLEGHELLSKDAYLNEARGFLRRLWSKYSRRRRMEICAEAGVSIFAARHQSFPFHHPAAQRLADAIL